MISANEQAEEILCRMEYLMLTDAESSAIVSVCRIELAVWEGDLNLPDRIAKRAKGIDDNLRKHLFDDVSEWMNEPVIKLK